jgi:hypothetical protein
MTLWRKHPDSSGLAQPRTFIRVFVAPGELRSAIAFYEKLLGTETRHVHANPVKGR